MSETPETPETDETLESGENEAAAPSGPRMTTPRVGLQGLLSRDSDVTLRPGFRNPANSRAKAQKKGGGKKARKR